MNSHTLIKDFLFAVIIIGIFCCFTLVAQAFQLKLILESEILNPDIQRAETNPIDITKRVEKVGDNFVPVYATFNIEREITDDTVVETDFDTEEKIESEVEPEKNVASVITAVTKIEEVPVQVVETKPVEIVAPPKSSNDSEFVQEIIDIINAETNSFRKANDLKPLQIDSVLAGNANNYSKTLLQGNFLSHTDKNGCDLTCRFENDGYVAKSWGENLAMIKFFEPISAEEVANYFMKEWKKSAGHKENLLSPKFAYQGIGVSVSNNAVYVSVQFAKP